MPDPYITEWLMERRFTVVQTEHGDRPAFEAALAPEPALFVELDIRRTAVGWRVTCLDCFGHHRRIACLLPDPFSVQCALPDWAVTFLGLEGAT